MINPNHLSVQDSFETSQKVLRIRTTIKVLDAEKENNHFDETSSFNEESTHIDTSSVILQSKKDKFFLVRAEKHLIFAINPTGRTKKETIESLLLASSTHEKTKNDDQRVLTMSKFKSQHCN